MAEWLGTCAALRALVCRCDAPDEKEHHAHNEQVPDLSGDRVPGIAHAVARGNLALAVPTLNAIFEVH